MTPEEARQHCPHLLSPAHLAIADSMGRWKLVPHLRVMNDTLVRAWLTPNSRTKISVPFQHGKSLLCSIYFPAWVLLLWPETRIALGSYETGFAANFGMRVRDIVNRYGPALDVELRVDTKAKSELKVSDFEDAEEVVASLFSVTQRGIIINGSDSHALMVYAIGKNPAKAKELAAITDPVKFCFAVAKMETQLKVTPRKLAPPPERRIGGTSGVGGSVDQNLEKLC